MSSQWLRWRWPRQVSAEAAVATMVALQSLSAPRRSASLLVEIAGTGGGIEHRLRVPVDRAEQAAIRLRQAMPGAVLEPVVEPESPELVAAASLRLTTGRRALATERTEQVAAGLLAVLGNLGAGEQVVLQWWLGPPRHPISLPSRTVVAEESRLARLWSLLVGGGQPLDAAARRDLLDKQGRPGWRLAGRVAVNQAAAAQRRLPAVTAALRSAQGPGVRLRVRRIPARVVNRRRLPVKWPLLGNVDELVALAALPVGEPEALPLPRSWHRLVPVDPAVPASGWTLGVGTHPRTRRPVAVSPSDRLRHLHVLGPTGVGKSTLLLNLISQDFDADRPLVVIEPKGDLIEQVLARVPARRQDDVVVVDPTEPDRPVGFNPLQLGGASRELAVDHLVAAFKGLFAASWGPRTQDLLTAGLMTLTYDPTLTLASLPQVFTDPALRRRLRASTTEADGGMLASFWAWYEQLSDAERASVLAPVMNKLRAFLLRSSVRAVVAQPQPRLHLDRLVSGRGVVLVDLRRDRIGAEAAGLVGSLVFAYLWQTLRGRGRGPHLGVYIDEFQDYLHLPTDAGEMLAQSRSLGVGLVVAHQHLEQLPRDLRAGVLANARSRVAFQLAYDDAHALARGHEQLEPADFMGLGAFEAYAQLSADGVSRGFTSLRTPPPPVTCSDSGQLRQASRERYGQPPVAERFPGPQSETAEAPIGTVPRRRQGGSS